MPAFNFDDAVIREIIEKTATEESVYKSALWNSGAITVDSALATLVGANDGRLFTTHFYRDLPDATDIDPTTTPAAAGPTYPDDSNVDIGVVDIDNAEFQVVKNGPIVSFSQKSITKRFNFLDDPVGVVSGLLTQYWANYLDQYAINTFIGVIADNVLNDASDLILDISNAANAPDPTNTLQPDTIILAENLKGDAADFSTLVMHSQVFNNLRIQNLIDTIPSSDGRVSFNLYQGKLIIISDNVEVNTAGAFPVFTTYLLGQDVMRYGTNLGADIIGFETWRDPLKGLGSGLDQIISRQQFALHPVGFSWLDNVVTGSISTTSGANIYPNWSDLRDGTNWDRVAFTKKHVPWVVIKSNG